MVASGLGERMERVACVSAERSPRETLDIARTESLAPRWQHSLAVLEAKRIIPVRVFEIDPNIGPRRSM